MIETIILGVVTLALIAFMAWNEYQHQQQIKMLVRAVKASTLNEMVYAEKPEADKVEVEPDFVPMETATDEIWQKHLGTLQDTEEEVESIK